MRILVAMFALLACLPAQAALAAPCTVSLLGNNLDLQDDDVTPALPLGFAFPMPGGGTTSAIHVAANGFVWLSNNSNDGCCDANTQDFLSDAPRIAVLWTDLDPRAAGAVYFATVAAGSGLPAHAIVTWQDVPEFGELIGMTMQLLLFADGSFLISYDTRTDVVTHTALLGVTEGLGASSQSIDFSVDTDWPGYDGGSNATVFELHAYGFDLAGDAYAFVPNGMGGYLVQNRSNCTFASIHEFGAGCPKPALAYEWFAMGDSLDVDFAAIEFTPAISGGYVAAPVPGIFFGYTQPITLADDSVAQVSLPFMFPYAGGAAPGATSNAIGICSNGFIWLQGGNSNARCCEGSVQAFHNDPASIAFLWQDLDPSRGGTCYFDTTPTAAHITFVDVPEYGTSNPNTAQLTLRSNGSFRIAWQNVTNEDHECVIGYSGGGIGGLLPPVDFLAGPSVSGGGGTPIQLFAGIGALPRPGTIVPLYSSQLPSNPSWMLMLLGTTAYIPSLPLGTLGMTGCELHVSLTSVQAINYTGSPSRFDLSIPNQSALVGYSLFAQTAVFAPTLNIGGFISSNALAITIGW